MGFRLGLVSNTVMPGEHLRKHFRDNNIECLFEAMVFSGDVGVSKPDARIFRHVLEKMNVAAKDAWYVGDKPARDVRGAHAAGMTGVLVHSRFHAQIYEAPENEPDLTIPNIAALPTLLDDVLL
jgi:putative hydrolase of the HAD superfamily